MFSILIFCPTVFSVCLVFIVDSVANNGRSLVIAERLLGLLGQKKLQICENDRTKLPIAEIFCSHSILNSV